MTHLFVKKSLGGYLVPIDDEGRAALSKVGRQEILSIEFKRPRNVRFHRKLFAMLHLILLNQSHYKTVDDLLDVCKLRIGHVRVIQTKRGEERIPASISFAAMDENSFSEFYDHAVDWMITEVIPGLNKGDLNNEVERELMEFAA